MSVPWLAPKTLCAEKSYILVGYPAGDNAIVAEHAAFVAAGPVVSVLLMGSCVECVKNMKERRCGMSTHEHWLVCALFISCCSRRPS